MSEHDASDDDDDFDLENRTKPASTWGQIGGGILLALLGGFFVAAGASDAPVATFIGFVLIGLGSIVSSIGVIAAGVRLGMDWVAYDRGQ